MKIYIIGSPASGKTTLSRKLSNKYNIPYYELDKLIYDDDNNHIKRTDQEVEKLFDEIINKDNWIIEDVGRSKFEKGRELADIIYYLALSKYLIMLRINTRWLKQRVGLENYNYPPTIEQLIDMNKTALSYLKKEPSKRASLNKYETKVLNLRKKDIKKL